MLSIILSCKDNIFPSDTHKKRDVNTYASLEYLEIKFYLIASVNSAPGLNLAIFLAGILIGAFVEGFIPILAALSFTEKVPKPIKETLSPPFKALDTLDIKASTALLESALLKPDSAAIAAINTVLFMVHKIKIVIIQ